MAKTDDKKVDASTVAPKVAPTVEAAPKTVRMKRVPVAGQPPGPTTADVHPDEVQAWRQHGWHLITE